MRFDYHGRWLRVSLELFPKRDLLERLRSHPPGKAPVIRRRLLRRIQGQLNPPISTV